MMVLMQPDGVMLSHQDSWFQTAISKAFVYLQCPSTFILFHKLFNGNSGNAHFTKISLDYDGPLSHHVADFDRKIAPKGSDTCPTNH
jgi:hypothetical protein